MQAGAGSLIFAASMFSIPLIIVGTNLKQPKAKQMIISVNETDLCNAMLHCDMLMLNLSL